MTERPRSMSRERMILVDCARALAHDDDVVAILSAMLDAIAGPLDIGSAAVVVPTGQSQDLGIAASIGLDDAAAAGLTAAMHNPDHPVARTVTLPIATYDVRPMKPRRAGPPKSSAADRSTRRRRPSGRRACARL